MIMAIGIATISAFPSGFCFFARRAPQAGHFFSLALICAPQERQITFRFQVPQFGHSFSLSSNASPQRGHLTEYTSFGMIRTPGFVRYNNFTTRVLQSQGQNYTKRNDKIWKIEEGGRKMVCIQDDMCYNKGEEIAPIEELRTELIEKIKQLPNEECKRILSIVNVESWRY